VASEDLERERIEGLGFCTRRRVALLLDHDSPSVDLSALLCECREDASGLHTCRCMLAFGTACRERPLLSESEDVQF
jgi:hypothetical protein